MSETLAERATQAAAACERNGSLDTAILLYQLAEALSWRTGVPLARRYVFARIRQRAYPVSGMLTRDGFTMHGEAVSPYDVTHWLPIPPLPDGQTRDLAARLAQHEGGEAI